MSTTTTQVKVTIPVELHEYLLSKAKKFGLSMSAYVKNLMINDVKDMKIPVFRASKRVEEAYKQSLQNQRDGKLIEANDLDEFFENL